MTRFRIHRYELFSRGSLNAKSTRRGHRGVLVRADSLPGTGCIHPWPELGDDPLDIQLDKLKSGVSTPLIAQALKCAATEISFDNLTIPGSHFTAAGSIETIDPETVRDAGFKTVKLKADGQAGSLGDLELESKRWMESGFRLRIDFNETATAPELIRSWENWEGKDHIDFFEDPIPWNPEDWTRLQKAGIPLAADRGIDIPAKAALADWWVVKPALASAKSVAKQGFDAGKRVIFTSYMDHAIGQQWAAYQAATCARFLAGECGLWTHPLFEPDLFFEKIEAEGLTTDFTDELNALEWETL